MDKVAKRVGAALGAGMLGMVGACGPDFDPRPLVDELRILAVQAEPPEAAPGEAVTYRALVADPRGGAAPLLYGFVQCTPTAAGCLEQAEALAAAGGDPEQAQVEYQKTSIRYGIGSLSEGRMEAIGANISAPLTLLDGVPNPDEGANNQVTFFVCDAESCLSGADAEAAQLPEDAEIAIKRARISTGDVPNRNPAFDRLEIGDGGEGAALREDEVVPITAGASVVLSAVLAPGSVEDYSYTTDDGIVEDRTERLYVGWYATAGEFERGTTTVEVDSSGEARAEVKYQAPEGEAVAEAAISLYAVVWDRRGGIGWITASLEIRP